ncbi:macro domain-containing protein [Thermosipho globiformans]|uniref:macro domain-containing protein n=1 Tax=Thermosipho globiformans TaxID=380685 RepID=UPI000F8CA872|nr:macro domain-containing protein [Thermosipho globiformans]
MMINLNGKKIVLINDDITIQDTDAIVNAANSHLKHGGGVAGAILKKGGHIIQLESDEYVEKYGPVKTGNVAVTTGGNLKAKYIIHAVGPIWRGGNNNEEKLLKDAVLNSLKKADELKIKSISFPAISSGIFGFPVRRCAQIFAKAIDEFLKDNTTIEEIRIVNIDKDIHQIFEEEFKKYFKLQG